MSGSESGESMDGHADPGRAEPTSEDADVELARLIQEQERALYVIQGAREATPDATAEEGDDDEAFARALQQQEAREFQARLLAMAGFAPGDPENGGDEEGEEDELDEGEDVDVDAMTYEELLALGDAAGHVSRSASVAAIQALPESIFTEEMMAKQKSAGSEQCEEQQCEQCAVCRQEYAVGDVLATLPCRHFYHSECVVPWLRVNKVCPVCKTEVTATPAPPPAAAAAVPTTSEDQRVAQAHRQPLQEAQSSSPATPADSGVAAAAAAKRDEPAASGGAAGGALTPVPLRLDMTPPPPAALVPAAAPPVMHRAPPPMVRSRLPR